MNYANAKPTKDRLIVERLKEEQEVVTEGGIILTSGIKHEEYKPNASKAGLLTELEQEEEAPVYIATVKVVGPTCSSVKAGTVILMGKYSGLDLLKDRTLFLIKEDDILAIMN